MASESLTATSTSTSSTSSFGDFFPDPSTITPTATNTPSPEDRRNSDITKSVLEYLFLSLAIVLVLGTVLRRILRLRRDNLPPSHFFVSHARRPRQTHHERQPLPRTRPTWHPPAAGEVSVYPPLAFVPGPPLPSVRTRPTRAADIGEGGRRLGEGETDYDGDLSDKDALPAYDKHGGPPRYVELDISGQPAVFSILQQNPGAAPEDPRSSHTPGQEGGAEVAAEQRPSSPDAPENRSAPDIGTSSAARTAALSPQPNEATTTTNT